MFLEDLYILTAMMFIASFGFIVLKVIFVHGMASPSQRTELVPELVHVAPTRRTHQTPDKFRFVPTDFRTAYNVR
jgi:hypothetical protein